MNETQCRLIVRERSGGICEGCLVRRATNMAHRKPKGQGGPWVPSNVVHLCGFGNHNNGSCHGFAENNATGAHDRGWRLWRNEDPLTVPFRLGGRAPVLLTDDGQRLPAPARCVCGKDAPYDGGAAGVCECCSGCAVAR